SLGQDLLRRPLDAALADRHHLHRLDEALRRLVGLDGLGGHLVVRLDPGDLVLGRLLPQVHGQQAELVEAVDVDLRRVDAGQGGSTSGCPATWPGWTWGLSSAGAAGLSSTGAVSATVFLVGSSAMYLPRSAPGAAGV